MEEYREADDRAIDEIVERYELAVLDKPYNWEWQKEQLIKRGMTFQTIERIRIHECGFEQGAIWWANNFGLAKEHNRRGNGRDNRRKFTDMLKSFLDSIVS